MSHHVRDTSLHDVPMSSSLQQEVVKETALTTTTGSDANCECHGLLPCMFLEYDNADDVTASALI